MTSWELETRPISSKTDFDRMREGRVVTRVVLKSSAGAERTGWCTPLYSAGLLGCPFVLLLLLNVRAVSAF